MIHTDEQLKEWAVMYLGPEDFFPTRQEAIEEVTREQRASKGKIDQAGVIDLTDQYSPGYVGWLMHAAPDDPNEAHDSRIILLGANDVRQLVFESGTVE